MLLIGFQLAGENANEKNLITGTRYMNVDGMLPFENQIDDYVEETNNHVLYRVTPIYDGNNLVCHGVQMEAKSVEDNGEGVMFNVFCYNVQPNINIDYATGESFQEGEGVVEEPVKNNSSSSNGITSSGSNIVENNSEVNERTYIVNTNTKKFHLPTCGSVSKMKPKNKKIVTDSRENLIAQGCTSCGNCHS